MGGTKFAVRVVAGDLRCVLKRETRTTKDYLPLPPASGGGGYHQRVLAERVVLEGSTKT